MESKLFSSEKASSSSWNVAANSNLMTELISQTATTNSTHLYSLDGLSNSQVSISIEQFQIL